MENAATMMEKKASGGYCIYGATGSVITIRNVSGGSVSQDDLYMEFDAKVRLRKQDLPRRYKKRSGT